MKTKKVFCGPADIAGNASKLARALRSVGVHATSYQRWKPIINYYPDKTEFYFGGIFKTNRFLRKINVLLIYCYFIKYLFSFKIFIFNNKKSLLPNNHDLPILKFFKKTIVSQFGGCDARTYRNGKYFTSIICDHCTYENRRRLNCEPFNKLEEKIEKVEYFSKYSDYIFSYYDCIINPKLKIYWKGNIAELPAKSDYSEKMNDKIITIAHFPTDRILKGTGYIEKVFEKINLEFKGKIKCKIFENISNQEVLHELENVHIVIDQLFAGYGGNLAIEALARGCLVFLRVDNEYSKLFEDHPYFHTTAFSLYEDIKKVISFSKPMLLSSSRKSQDFYYLHHTPNKIGSYYKRILCV